MHKGLDPESYTQTILSQETRTGGDGGSYPNAKIWTFGLIQTFNFKQGIAMKKISFILMLVLMVTSCEDFYEEDLSTLITAESGALTSEQGSFCCTFRRI